MGIHLDRNDFLQGSTPPINIVPEFVGQFYVDTTHEIAYQNLNGRANGWVQTAKHAHFHKVDEIVDLEEYVESFVNQNYITDAIQALRTTGNHWSGLNNFQTLRVNSQDVLTTGSNLTDLSDVLADLSNAEPGQVLGWNGSGWSLYNPDGTLPSGEGYDFTNFITKNSITTAINSNSTTEVLAASAASAIVAYVDTNFATKGHVHDEYATADHVHTNHFRNDDYNEVTGNSSIFGEFFFTDEGATNRPVTFASQGGDATIKTPATSLDNYKFELDGKAGAKQSLYIGGREESSAGELVLNFETVRIPTGRLLADDETGRIVFSPIKIETPENIPTKYVGSGYSKDYGLNLSNTSLIGLNQLVFARASMSQTDAIMFPKSHAGNTQPTEIGLYNYLYLLDDLMHTDTALASTKNFIQLAGRKIFFGPAQPGREAKPGDVWVRI